MNPEIQDSNRDETGRFKPGFSGNPNGRPKGKTLKEFAREYLLSLPDEEKLEYLKKLPFDIVWKMAEGNPKQDTDVTTGGESFNSVILLPRKDGEDTLEATTETGTSPR